MSEYEGLLTVDEEESSVFGSVMETSTNSLVSQPVLPSDVFTLTHASLLLSRTVTVTPSFITPCVL